MIKAIFVLCSFFSLMLRADHATSSRKARSLPDSPIVFELKKMYEITVTKPDSVFTSDSKARQIYVRGKASEPGKPDESQKENPMCIPKLGNYPQGGVDKPIQFTNVTVDSIELPGKDGTGGVIKMRWISLDPLYAAFVDCKNWGPLVKKNGGNFTNETLKTIMGDFIGEIKAK